MAEFSSANFERSKAMLSESLGQLERDLQSEKAALPKERLTDLQKKVQALRENLEPAETQAAKQLDQISNEIQKLTAKDAETPGAQIGGGEGNRELLALIQGWHQQVDAFKLTAKGPTYRVEEKGPGEGVS